MNLKSYADRLAKKFNEQSDAWPEAKAELENLLRETMSALDALLGGSRAETERALRAASAAHFALGKMALKKHDDGKLPFLEQTSRYLTALEKFTAFNGIKPLKVIGERPSGYVIMYRGADFLKMLHVDESGAIKHKSLKTRSPNESHFIFTDGVAFIGDADEKPTTNFFAIAEASDATVYIGFYEKDPLNLHCFLFGAPAQTLFAAGKQMSALKPSDLVPIKPRPANPGQDIHAVENRSGRAVPLSRMNIAQILATASHSGWAFSAPLTISELCRFMRKAPVLAEDGVDVSASLDATLDFKSCVVVKGYTTLYHCVNSRNESIFILDGQGSTAIVGKSFMVGSIERFKSKTGFYLDHFMPPAERTDNDFRKSFYILANVLFQASPAQKQSEELTIAYGNWRVGDCVFGMAGVRQMAELGFSIRLLRSDAELISLGTQPSGDVLRMLFTPPAKSTTTISAHIGYTDGLTDLFSGTIGMNLCERFPYQQRGRAFGNVWQSVMYPEHSSASGALLSQKAAETRSGAGRPFGIFFSLDLEKRRWLEQEVFLEKLAQWCVAQASDIRIFINGMTSYDSPHRMGTPTLRTMLQEETVLDALEQRIGMKAAGFRFHRLSEMSLKDKFENIRDRIDLVIGPFGSGTVVPSFLFNKPGLVYSSKAMFKMCSEVYLSVDQLAGSETDLVPLEWVTDADTRDHRIFPDAEMTNYSIPEDRVLKLATSLMAFHSARLSET